MTILTIFSDLGTSVRRCRPACKGCVYVKPPARRSNNYRYEISLIRLPCDFQQRDAAMNQAFYNLPLQ